MRNIYTMRQNYKSPFFVNLIVLYVIFFLFSGCGLPKDTKEDIEVISKAAESIDKSMETFVDIAEKKGVQIIIKDADLPEDVKEVFKKINDILNHDNGVGTGAEAALRTEVVLPSMEDVFSEMNENEDEDLLQSISDKIMEELEKLELSEETRKEIEERLMREFRQLLEEQ